MGDDEHPRAELALAAVEARQVAHDLEEHLACEILRLARAPGAQVAEHDGDEIPVDVGPGPLGARSGRGEDHGELCA